jgi:hypothetical protein
MDTHSMIFRTVDNRVSPSSSVNGDPLDDFPDHWQPRFSFAGQVKRRTGPPPPNERSVRSRLLKPGRQAVGSVSLVSLTRQDVYS